MSFEETYSMRISEVLEYIEVKQKQETDLLNIQLQIFGTLCATIANFSMNKPKHKKFKAKDFFKPISENKKEKKKQSSEDMAKILEAITIGLGGEVIG